MFKRGHSLYTIPIYNIQPPLDNSNVIEIKYMVCCIIALIRMENSMSLQQCLCQCFRFFLLLVFIVGVTSEFGHEHVQEVNIQYGG